MDRAFVVMVHRRDGAMPSLCKALWDRLFFTWLDARGTMVEKCLDKEMYGVYEVRVQVVGRADTCPE